MIKCIFSRVMAICKRKTAALAMAAMIGVVLGMASLAFAAPTDTSATEGSGTVGIMSSRLTAAAEPPEEVDWASIEEWQGPFDWHWWHSYLDIRESGTIKASLTPGGVELTATRYKGTISGQASISDRGGACTGGLSFSDVGSGDNWLLSIEPDAGVWKLQFPYVNVPIAGECMVPSPWPIQPMLTFNDAEDPIIAGMPLPATGKTLSADYQDYPAYPPDVWSSFSATLYPTKWVQVKIPSVKQRKGISPNQNVTFVLQRNDGTLVNAEWSGGGTPETGTGTSFTTRFNANPGFGGVDKTVKATAVESGAIAQGTVKVMKPSGTAWVSQYPDNNSLEALSEPFQQNARNFVGALQGATATDNNPATNPDKQVGIVQVYRPSKRAHLMYWSWRIAKTGYLPENVPTPECANTDPAHGPVYIAWKHYRLDGSYDRATSITEATKMFTSYNVSPQSPVAHPSRHEIHRAIDLRIKWNGTLRIMDVDGNIVPINTTPLDGTNAKLGGVGAGYGVLKGTSFNHWSDNGR